MQTSLAPAVAVDSLPVPAAMPFKAVVAVVIGNLLEFYDFLVFTFFAVMIADAFFPGESQIGRLLGALATFGVGFVTRPLGAAVIGAYADRAGRRAALTVTLMLMAVGSGLIAVTPPYAQIGIAAPIILLIARLIQGFSCGGEVGPATTYLLESVAIEKRAAVTAWQGYSQQIAIFLGSLVGVILTTSLSSDQMHAWGWRVPFLLGVGIVPVALYIRRQLPETLERSEAHHSSRAVLGELLRNHWRPVAAGVLIVCGGTISTYMFNYMTTYAIVTLHLSAAIGTTLTLTGSVAAIVGLRVGVWADTFGRKAALVSSRALFALILYPAYLLLTSPARRSDPHHRDQHGAQLRVLDRDRSGVRLSAGGVSQGGAFEWTVCALRARGDDLRRHDTVCRGVAD